MPNRLACVTFRRKGLHRYPGAAAASAPPAHRYLADEHRHLFHFKVCVEVLHGDREVEFHALLDWLEELYGSGTLALDHRSCEMIADELHTRIAGRHPGRRMLIEVWEDGECGAVAEYAAGKEAAS